MAAKQPSKLEIMENTELIKLDMERYQYINTSYEKVHAKMYDSKCNIKLRIGKQSFRAHKDVLSQASDYFAAMFGHNMKEKESQEVELYEISPQGFTSMLEYFYHGHITVKSDNIDDILEASRFFQVDWLVTVCCDFLIRYLAVENYEGVLQLADQYALGDFRKEIFRFIGLNFRSLAKEARMMKMAPELFHTLLSENHVIEATEGIVLETLIQWLQYEPNERTQFISYIKLIRFPLVDLSILNEISSEFCDDEVNKMIAEAKIYQEDPPRQSLLQSEKTKVRGSREMVTLFSAVEDANLLQYKLPNEPDFITEEIDTVFMESFFEFSSVAVLGNFLYVAGGYNRNKYVSSPVFYRYDPRFRSWDNLSSMHQPRVSFSLCAVSNGLYAINGIEHITDGGFDREQILHSVEFYSPESNIWRLYPEMQFGCFSCAAASIDDVVYVSGGITDDPEDTVPVQTLYTFMPDENSWVEKAAMLTPRQSHAMVECNQKLYVFGGFTTGEDTMSFSHCLLGEMYDPCTDQWTAIKPIPEYFIHGFASATVKDNCVFIVGGAPDDPDRFLCCYDTEKDKMDEGQGCGVNVVKLVTLDVVLPLDLE